jgi:hypothetical protein
VGSLGINAFLHWVDILKPEEEERTWGRVVRHYLFQAGGDNIFPVLKVPKQCPFAFMVEVRLM